MEALEEKERLQVALAGRVALVDGVDVAEGVDDVDLPGAGGSAVVAPRVAVVRPMPLTLKLVRAFMSRARDRPKTRLLAAATSSPKPPPKPER